MFWTCKAKIFRNPRQCNTLDSGQIIIFPPPRFPWNSRACPFQNATFWGGFRSCEVATIWPSQDGTLASKQGRPPETVRLMLPWLKDTPGKTDPGRKLPYFLVWGPSQLLMICAINHQTLGFLLIRNMTQQHNTTKRHKERSKQTKPTKQTKQNHKPNKANRQTHKPCSGKRPANLKTIPNWSKSEKSHEPNFALFFQRSVARRYTGIPISTTYCHWVHSLHFASSQRHSSSTKLDTLV